jgi:hypothetical protein
MAVNHRDEQAVGQMDSDPGFLGLQWISNPQHRRTSPTNKQGEKSLGETVINVALQTLTVEAVKAAISGGSIV